MNLYLDLESIPQPLEQREWDRPTHADVPKNIKDPVKRSAHLLKLTNAWEQGEKAALDATTGQVVLIGLYPDWPVIQHRPLHSGKPIGVWSHVDEIGLLTEFWGQVAVLDFGVNDKIVGFNIIGFDLPFIIRRSMILGVDHRGSNAANILWDDVKAYQTDHTIDLMRVWQMNNRRDYISLKSLCGAFGIPVKEGPVNGKNFHEFWNGTATEKLSADVQRQLCLDYNKMDLEATRELHKRMVGGK